MRAGIYAPVAHVVPHIPELADIARESALPLNTGERDRGYELVRRFILDADRMGFDIALFAERHIGQDLEAWILASSLAGQTNRIRVMPAVNPDFWHPGLIAKMAASLDRIAPGRSAINFVTGWNEAEHKAFSSVRHPDDDAKYARAEEFVDTMRALWTGEPVTQGGFFPLEDVAIPLIPAGDPPPIYAVSRSDRGLDMVARSADYWFADYGAEPELPFEVICDRLSAAIDDMRRRADARGREVRFGISAFVLPGADVATASGRATRLIEENPHWMSDIQWFGRSVGLVGPAELIQERLAILDKLGVDLLLSRYIPVDGELEAISESLHPILG